MLVYHTICTVSSKLQPPKCGFLLVFFLYKLLITDTSFSNISITFLCPYGQQQRLLDNIDVKICEDTGSILFIRHHVQ